MINRKLIEDAIDSALDKVLNEQYQEQPSAEESIENSTDNLDKDKIDVEKTRASEVDSVKVLNEQTNFEKKVDEDTPIETTSAENSPATDAPVETIPVEDTLVEDTPAENTPTEDIPLTDIPSEDEVTEKIEDVIKEEVEKVKNYSFLGLDIHIDTVEDGFNVTISKNGIDTIEHLDSLELPNLLGIVETFFNKLVLNEEENEEENIDEDSDNVTLASLRKLYSSRIEKFLNHGLLAKNLALSMVKEKITGKNVKELLDKIEEKNAVLSNLKKDFKINVENYIVSTKLNDQYKRATSLTSSAIDKLHDGLTKGVVSKEIALKAINKYKTILSNIINSKSFNAVIASVNNINKVNVIIANYINENEKRIGIIASKTNNSKKIKIKKENKPILNKKRFVTTNNVLNSNAWNDNSTLLSQVRHDGIEEMSSEIMRIAGILDEENY